MPWIDRSKVFKYRHYIAIGLLFILTFIIYYPSLFQIPRADQLNYILQIKWYLLRNADASYFENIIHLMSLNRSQWIGDIYLFRPFSYILLFLEYTLFQNKFVLWQLTSVFLHVMTALSMYWALLAADENPKKSWNIAFLGGLFFAVAFPGMENVTWNHIPGYIVATMGMILSVGWFARVIKSNNFSYFKYLFLTILVTCFFYELASFLAIMMVASLLYKAYIGKRDKQDYLKYACYLLVVPILWGALNILDYQLRFDPSYVAQKENPIMGIGQVIINAYLFVEHLFLAEIAPQIIDYHLQERLELIPDGVNTYKLEFFKILPGALFIILAATTIYKRFTLQKREHYLVGLLCLIMIALYAGIVAWGRMQFRGYLPMMIVNVYYAYIFLSFAVLALGFTWPVNSQVFSLQNNKWIFRIFQISFAVLIVWHFQQTLRMSKKIRNAQAPRWELVHRVDEFVKDHSNDANFSFSLDKPCIGNPSFAWFDLPDTRPNLIELSILDVLFWKKYKSTGGQFTFACDK